MSEWHRAEIERRDERIVELRAEIERLRLEWRVSEAGHRKTMAQLIEAAAFLDRTAEIIGRALRWCDGQDDNAGLRQAAADCRAMAEKLRK